MLSIAFFAANWLAETYREEYQEMEWALGTVEEDVLTPIEWEMEIFDEKVFEPIDWESEMFDEKVFTPQTNSNVEDISAKAECHKLFIGRSGSTRKKSVASPIEDCLGSAIFRPMWSPLKQFVFDQTMEWELETMEEDVFTPIDWESEMFDENVFTPQTNSNVEDISAKAECHKLFIGRSGSTIKKSVASPIEDCLGSAIFRSMSSPLKQFVFDQTMEWELETMEEDVFTPIDWESEMLDENVFTPQTNSNVEDISAKAECHKLFIGRSGSTIKKSVASPIEDCLGSAIFRSMSSPLKQFVFDKTMEWELETVEEDVFTPIDWESEMFDEKVFTPQTNSNVEDISAKAECHKLFIDRSGSTIKKSVASPIEDCLGSAIFRSMSSPLKQFVFDQTMEWELETVEEDVFTPIDWDSEMFDEKCSHHKQTAMLKTLVLRQNITNSSLVEVEVHD